MGVTWYPDLDAFNVAVYSHHATALVLETFCAERPAEVVTRVEFDPLRNKTGRVWHYLLPAKSLNGATLYGFRVDGPWKPAEGHRFDPGKLLVDPYATEIWFPPGFDRGAASVPGDNAGKAPLGVLRREQRPHYPAQNKPGAHGHDAVIYELHVRGFTAAASSGVAAPRRGTFAGLIDKIPYLVDLGVTIVELMPVHQFDPQEGNYWGYMTLGFFAPHRGYAATADPVAEFRDMVAAFHAAGIEVMMDVVYNHTAEGGASGPTYSFRGLDNKSYYLLHQEDPSRYVDDAGCGNVTRAGHGVVRRLVVDSMRYWSGALGVDGFRFDLAALLARDADGSVRHAHAPLVSQLTDEATRADLRLVAEAWDLRTQLLGKTFPGYSWGQWNCWFRDDVRRFVRGDDGVLGAVLTRLYGSDDVFPDTVADAYRPDQSINYLASHDGMSLYDVVAYDRKRNDANGHDGRDGAEDDCSWNSGWEGTPAPPEVEQLRQQQMRNFATLLMLANGTPMFRAGDEFGHSQGGNNNPYNQDNETSWLDWSLLDHRADLHRFWKLLIAFRTAHPSIARGRYWRDDVTWFGVDSALDLGHWSKAFAFHLCGAAEQDDDLYVMVNAFHEQLTFRLQAMASAGWLRVVDTAQPSPDDIVPPGEEQTADGSPIVVAARSIVVLRLPQRASIDRPNEGEGNDG